MKARYRLRNGKVATTMNTECTITFEHIEWAIADLVMDRFYDIKQNNLDVQTPAIKLIRSKRIIEERIKQNCRLQGEDYPFIAGEMTPYNGDAHGLLSYYTWEEVRDIAIELYSDFYDNAIILAHKRNKALNNILS